MDIIINDNNINTILNIEETILETTIVIDEIIFNPILNINETVLETTLIVEPMQIPAADGKSAYEIALENGFVGTEVQWLASLQGANGVGVPAGGTVNQLLKKVNSTDYNTVWSTVDKVFVGLGNVDNTTDLLKPISTATQTALNLLVPYVGAIQDLNLGLFDITAAHLIKNGGVSTQFLKADGSVDNNVYLTSANLPSTLDLYATTTASDISGYTVLVRNISDSRFNNVAVDVSTGEITTTAQLVGSLVTDSNIISGDPGIFNITTIGNISRTSGTGQAEFFFRVYKRDNLGVETFITQSANTIPVTNGGYTEFSAVALWNDGIFLDTDRIVLKYYANRLTSPVGSNPTYKFQFGGISPVRSTAAIPVAVLPNIYLKDLADVENVPALNNEVLYWNDMANLWEHSSVIDLLSPASSTIDGYLSFTDWTTFNGKQNSISITTLGTSGAATFISNVLNIPQYTEIYNGTVTNVSALTLGTTGTDLTSTVENGTTTPVITLNVPTASATNRGALSKTDWTAFNGKFNLPSLTSGSVLFSDGTTIAQKNSNFYWDNTNNRLGIGTNAPTKTFELVGTSLVNFLVRNGSTNMLSTEATGIGGSDFRLRFWNNANTQTLDLYGSGNYDHQNLHAFRISTVEKMRLNSSGNLLINTTTDNGGKLQIKAAGALSTDIALRVRNSADTGDILLSKGDGSFLSQVPSGATTNTFTIISNLSRLDISPYDSSTYGVILRPSANNAGALMPLSLWGSKINIDNSTHIKVNATGANASAMLDVESTTKGFLPPRMTNAQKNAIATPASGLVVYDTTLGKLCVRGAASWETITSI